MAEAIVGRAILAARAREASRAAQAEVTRAHRDHRTAEPAGQVERLQQLGPRRQRAVRRRGRLGRRLGQAGARPRAPGDPAAARQGDEHRGHDALEGAREQGAVRPGHRARLRHGQELRPRAAALRQGDHPGRRRLRRPPHRDAADDVPLPAPAAAHRGRQDLPGAAAALPHRHRQGVALGARRRAARPHREAARQRPRLSPTSPGSRGWAR